MKIKRIIPILITISLVLFLFSRIQFDLSKIVETIGNISLPLVFVGFTFYLINYFLKTLRFKILLNEDIKISEMFKVVAIHNMLLNIFPFRAGEVSYPYLLKKIKNISLGKGVSSLGMARLFDIIIISVLFFIALLGIQSLYIATFKITTAVLVLLFLAALILITLRFYSQKLVNFIKYTIKKTTLDRFRPIQLIESKIEEIISGFNIIKSTRTIIFTLLLSVLIWLSLYSVNYMLIKAVGIELSIWEVLFVSTLFISVAMFPISVAGLGTSEATWAVIMMSFGVASEKAISTGFTVHVLLLIYIILLGIYGFNSTRPK